MFPKKKVMKELLSNKDVIVNKMTDEFMVFLSKFDKKRTIESIKREEVEEIAKDNFKKAMKIF